MVINMNEAYISLNLESLTQSCAHLYQSIFDLPSNVETW
jgi:hypothetical protein